MRLRIVSRGKQMVAANVPVMDPMTRLLMGLCFLRKGGGGRTVGSASAFCVGSVAIGACQLYALSKHY